MCYVPILLFSCSLVLLFFLKSLLFLCSSVLSMVVDVVNVYCCFCVEFISRSTETYNCEIKIFYATNAS